MKYRILVLVSVPLFFILPVRASAAPTPQASFNSAWSATFGHPKNPLRISMTYDLLISSKSSNQKLADTVILKGTLNTRRRGTAPWGRQDSEGSATLRTLNVSYSNPPLSIDAVKPIQIEWKHVDQEAYVRFKTEEIPQGLLKYSPSLKSMNNMWLVSSSTSAAAGALSVSSVVPCFSFDPTNFDNMPPSIFTVTKVEKRYTRKDGSKIMRVHMRINPTALAAEIKKGNKCKSAPKNASDSVKLAIDEAKTVRAAADINLRTNSIERVELADSVTSSTRAKAGKPASTFTSKIAIGADIKRDGNWTVVEPQTQNSLNGAIMTVAGEALMSLFANSTGTFFFAAQNDAKLVPNTKETYEVITDSGSRSTVSIETSASGTLIGTSWFSTEKSPDALRTERLYLKEGWDAGIGSSFVSEVRENSIDKISRHSALLNKLATLNKQGTVAWKYASEQVLFTINLIEGYTISSDNYTDLLKAHISLAKS